MPRTAPIGREREFNALVAAAGDAAGGFKSIVFLAGATGSGKSALVRALTDAVATDPAPRPDVVQSCVTRRARATHSGRSGRCCGR